MYMRNIQGQPLTTPMCETRTSRLSKIVLNRTKRYKRICLLTNLLVLCYDEISIVNEHYD